jgi:hypothetical protein
MNPAAKQQHTENDPCVSTITSDNGKHSLFQYWFIIISGSVVLVRTLAASLRRFRNLMKTLGRTPLEERSARLKGLYLHRETQHRNTKANIYTSSGIRTHDPSNQTAKTYALDRADTGTGFNTGYSAQFSRHCLLTIRSSQMAFNVFRLSV